MPPRFPPSLDDDQPALGGGIIESVEHDRAVGGDVPDEMTGRGTKDDIARPPTALSPPEERRFRSWVALHNIPFDPSVHSTYDMRGFWKAYQAGDQGARQDFENWRRKQQETK